MRQVWGLALCVVPAFLAACSGGHHASDGTPDPAALRLRPAPAQFVIRPNIADPHCNGGRGLRFPARLGVNSFVAAGASDDGSTLIAVSEYATKNTVDLYAVSRSCVPIREIGRAGRTTITHSSRPPAHTDYQTLPDALWINAVTPTSGGALLAGAYGGRWVVAAVTRRVRLDPAFGNGGWAVLPFHGEATAIRQAPSGRIVVGGEDGRRGGLWAAVLSDRGQLDRGFGTNGLAQLAVLGADSGIGTLAIEPSGKVLANMGFGNMGCWRDALAMLTPSGQPVRHFRRHLGPFGRFWRRLGFNAFVGDVYVDDDGFTLVGTGQRPCAESPATASARSATGLIARFRTDGRPAGPLVRFPSRMYGQVRPFRNDDGTTVVTSPYADTTRLTLTALRPDGSIDSLFGSHGRARIRTPWRGRNAALDTTVLITRAAPRAIALVATRAGLKQMQIIRVLL